MQKQTIVKIEPNDLLSAFAESVASKKQPPGYGQSPNEAAHRRLAGNLVTTLKHRGYFEPHVHLAKQAQDIKYGQQTDRFKARLHLGVDFCVESPCTSKRHFLDLLLEQIDVENSGVNRNWLTEAASKLRSEWLVELEHRVRQQYVARVAHPGQRLPESSLVSDPRTIEAATVAIPSHLEHPVKRPACPGCVDVDPFAGEKDQMLCQKLFQNCVTRDIFDAFRRQATEHLADEIEACWLRWYQRAVEEIVDLMRGPWQPQDAANLRILVDERKIQGGREPQPDMAKYRSGVPYE